MHKVLVVEDEKPIAKLLKYNLEKEGYKVEVSADGEDALVSFRKFIPSFVILDLMIPKIDGIELCKIIRKESKVPILMLTAKNEEADRVIGLELGADDYVTKPFSVREVMARVKSILRRVNDKEDSGSHNIGKLEIDLERYEVKLSGKPVNLSSKEFAFLKVLLQAKGKVLTRDQLLEAVWGYDQASEIDTRTIDQHVARLRAKLKDEAGRLLTVKNIGYRLKID